MSIKTLPENVWSKIAAGEVIERPANVVKELVENSLDAKSKRIKVKLFDGGRLRIIIEDDGTGISFDDLPLALMYHATSKISEVEDLESIKTLGYRGEALASITAVADVEIKSKNENEEVGGLIRAHEGKIIEHEKINHPQGTRIQVENLFVNLPARRKFLKTAQAELRKSSEFLREYAVCNPDIAFTLESDMREIFSTDGAGYRKKVLQKFWEKGAEIQNTNISIGHLNLECWFQSRAGIQSGYNNVMAFVNGRTVDDTIIKSAVKQAARELNGNWALFFKIEESLVDVNIHPAKLEVRFRYPDEIYKAVHSAVKNLGTPMFIPKVSNFNEPVKKFNPLPKKSNISFNPKKNFTPQKNYEPQIYLEDLHPQIKINEPEIIYMGQNSGGYLIYDDGEKTIFIDPHAAHERINYEKIKSKAEKSENLQKLLTPLLLHPTLTLEVNEYENELKKSGFEFNKTNSGVELISVPSIGVDFEPLTLLRASLGALKNYHDGDTKNILWRTWATMACKASVKLTTKLSNNEALILWKDLHECEQPFVCPHGRPTMIEIKNSDLQKNFGRDSN